MHCGAISRFVNHLCEPNTIVVALGDYTDGTNPRKMFLRSLSRINKGDELTRRYSVKKINFSCLCMAIFTVFGEIQPRMQMMSKQFDALLLGYAPLAALHASLLMTVLVSVDSLLVRLPYEMYRQVYQI